MFLAILKDGQSHFLIKKINLKAKNPPVQLMTTDPGLRQKKAALGRASSNCALQFMGEVGSVFTKWEEEYKKVLLSCQLFMSLCLFNYELNITVVETRRCKYLMPWHQNSVEAFKVVLHYCLLCGDDLWGSNSKRWRFACIPWCMVGCMFGLEAQTISFVPLQLVNPSLQLLLWINLLFCEETHKVQLW